MSLQIRRGTNSQRGGVTFDSGEPVWTTDTKKLYVGDGSTAGGNGVAMDGHVHSASDVTSGSFGNITYDGKIGSTSGLPVVTGASGAVTTLAISGQASKYVRVKSDETGLEFATVSASGGGTKTYAKFTPFDACPPTTNFATIDTRNNIPVLEFDGGSTDESTTFVGVMPEAASLASGLIVKITWMADTATSGNVRWGVQFERMTTDLDADSFDTAVEANSAANGTSGIPSTVEITITTIDSIAAGDAFRLKVYREASDTTNDTMSGDAQLITVEVRSAA